MSRHPMVGRCHDTFNYTPLDDLPDCFLFFVITKSIVILKKNFLVRMPAGVCVPLQGRFRETGLP